MWQMSQSPSRIAASEGVSEEAGRRSDPHQGNVTVGYFLFGAARPTYPRYPRYPQAEVPRFRWCESVRGDRLAFRDEERSSARNEEPKCDHRGSGRCSSERRPPKRWNGYLKKKREASADPNFFKCPAETGAFGRTDREREPTGVARPRPEPARAPVEACFERTSPQLGKDAKPSPARQFGPGTSGGWQRCQLPF